MSILKQKATDKVDELSIAFYDKLFDEFTSAESMIDNDRSTSDLITFEQYRDTYFTSLTEEERFKKCKIAVAKITQANMVTNGLRTLLNSTIRTIDHNIIADKPKINAQLSLVQNDYSEEENLTTSPPSIVEPVVEKPKGRKRKDTSDSNKSNNILEPSINNELTMIDQSTMTTNQLIMTDQSSSAPPVAAKPKRTRVTKTKTKVTN